MSRKLLLLGSVAGFIIGSSAVAGLYSIRAPYTRLSPDGEIIQQVRVLERGERSFDYNDYIQSRVREEQSKINAYSEDIGVYSNEAYEHHQAVEPEYLDPDLELYAFLEQNNAAAQPAQTVEASTPTAQEAPAVEEAAPVVETPAVETATQETPAVQTPVQEAPVQAPAADQEIVVDMAAIPSRPVTVRNGAQIQFEQDDQGRASIRIEGPLPAGSILVLQNLPATPQQAADRVVRTVQREAAVSEARQVVEQVQQAEQTPSVQDIVTNFDRLSQQAEQNDAPAPAVETPQTAPVQEATPAEQAPAVTPQATEQAPIEQPGQQDVGVQADTSSNASFTSDMLNDMWNGIRFAGEVGYNLGERGVHSLDELAKDAGLRRRTEIETLVRQIKADEAQADRMNEMMGWGTGRRMGIYADGTYEGLDVTALDKTETYLAEKSRQAAQGAAQLGADAKDMAAQAATRIQTALTPDSPAQTEQVAQPAPTAEKPAESQEKPGFFASLGNGISNLYRDSWLQSGVKGTQELAEKTGEALKTAAQKTGETLQTAAGKTGAAIEDAYQDSWLDKGVQEVAGLFSGDKTAENDQPVEGTQAETAEPQTVAEAPAPEQVNVTVQAPQEEPGFFTTVSNTWDDLYKDSWAEKSVDWTQEAYKGSWLETGVDKTVEAGRFVGELGLNIGQEAVRAGDEALKDVGLKERTPTEQLVKHIKDEQKRIDEINQVFGMDTPDTAPKFAIYADGTYEGFDVTALDKTKTAVKETAQTIADGTQELAEKTGEALKTAAQKTGETLQTAAGKTGAAIEDAYQDSWLDKGVQEVAGLFSDDNVSEEIATAQPAEAPAATESEIDQTQLAEAQPSITVDAPQEDTGFFTSVGDSIKSAAQKTVKGIEDAYEDSWLDKGAKGTLAWVDQAGKGIETGYKKTVDGISSLFSNDEKPTDELARLQQENKELHEENMRLKLELAQLKARQTKESATTTHETYRLADAYATAQDVNITVKSNLLSTLQQSEKTPDAQTVHVKVDKTQGR